MHIVLQILLLMAGFILLVKGADFFVDGAAAIASKLGVPQIVIGLTIVAMGTSLPETAVGITSALKGSAGITVGNVVGSNILTVLLVLGVTALFTNVAVQKNTLRYEIPFMISSTAVMMLFGLFAGQLTRLTGIVFLLLFAAFLVYLFHLAKTGNSAEDPGEIKQMSLIKCILFIILGCAMILFGSDFAVDAATEIAKALGVSDRIIGLTVVSIGTALPEFVTSVTAARRGNADLAIGNIVGSNIFNILFVAGLSALICNVPFETSFLIDCGVLLFSGCILLLGTIKNKQLKRPCGILMIGVYAVYLAYLFLAQ